MSMQKIIIDGQEFLVQPGGTVYEACKQASIHIPVLCHHPLLKPAGSCMICCVALEGHGLVPACSTLTADGMVLFTGTASVIEARRQKIRDMLDSHYGDCLPPCSLACPIGLDVQGYIELISRGLYREAAALIKETLPFPAVIGRVCPRPCENACRRSLVEQPVAICSLKRFVADFDLLEAGTFVPSRKAPKGKDVAIIGAGPAGLSAAYYLAREGYGITVFEAMPEPGGMLRYTIPEYRLPKDILDREIRVITSLGVTIRQNSRLGRDFTLKSLMNDGFSAVFIGVGAQRSLKMGIEGEELAGVMSGNDFLYSVFLEKPVADLNRVVVIGGGNTAIDAARTAVRLGAKNVTVIYRRSRSEMPAIEGEIEEAEEEGVDFHMLAAPVRIMGENGRVKCIECINMTEGKPDADGRASLEPVPGSEFVLTADLVITAIGQQPDTLFLNEEIDVDLRQGKISAAADNMMTNMPGVFAGGDCLTGSTVAIEAIAGARKAALAIDDYLQNRAIESPPPVFNVSKGLLGQLAGKIEFTAVEKKFRRKMPTLRVSERSSNFAEAELGYTEEMARREAARCLRCGCRAVEDCSLRQLAAEYNVTDTGNLAVEQYYPLDKSHPFIERDANKCIGCQRCARICLEIQSAGALSINQRVGTVEGFGGSLLNTPCVACGQCLAACPTGALYAKSEPVHVREIKSICHYCGVGCGINIGVNSGQVVSIRGDVDNPVNKGLLCAKGRFGYEFVNHAERLKTPLIKSGGEFVQANWEEALDLIASRLAASKGSRFGAISSAKCTNEDNYVFQKFTRSVMKTNNIDHCARLCHAPSVAGLAQSLGSGAMTNSIAEIQHASCIFAIGSNTTASHPVIGIEVTKAVRNGARLIVANPRKIDLCRFASLWLPHRPGTDVALLNGMMHIIVRDNLHDSGFIQARCEGYEALVDSLQKFTPYNVEKITGLSGEKVAEAARLYAMHDPAMILYAMGITQHTHGTDNVLAVSNLAMLTGNLGKPSSGVNPLRGQNNVQGSCDMGALPNVYPGYQPVNNAEKRKIFEQAWNCELDPNPGLTLTEMLDAVEEKKISALYIMGENPVLSEPDASRARQALEAVEFLVVQDIFLTETALLADVVLPAAAFGEKSGTFTNTERRVQRVYKAVEPAGQSLPDWEIICRIARAMGADGFGFGNESEVFDEIARLAPAFGGMNYQRLEISGLQWPCPSYGHPGTPILHRDKFITDSGKGCFKTLDYRPPAEEADEEYPLLLTTERSLYHYHTGTMTRRVNGLNVLRPAELVEINPEDARTLDIKDSDTVRVVSRRGAVTARARVTSDSPRGVISMTFHFAESPTNILTSPALDPVAKIPELKVCAVRVEKTGFLPTVV
jgi:formate dehydrogenase major subunit